MRLFTIVLAAAALPACATLSAQPHAGAVRSISYETGPCFGACPVYRVTVSSNGAGTFEGRRFTAVTGTRAFRVTPAQFRAFAARLAPVRPARGEVRHAPPNCKTTATDMPSANVGWTMADGSTRGLYFYYGCDMAENRALAERLRNAPSALPIAELIGPRL